MVHLGLDRWRRRSRGGLEGARLPVGDLGVGVLPRGGCRQRARFRSGRGLTGVGIETDDLEIRRATDDDRPAVIDLCRASLGWKAGDPNEAFFAWKPDENAFGTFPAWVAVTPDGTLAGLRVFLRGGLRRPDGSAFDAVRAVDAATHPDWQGRVIFTRL